MLLMSAAFLPPFVSVWLPVVLTGLLALGLLRRIET